MELASQNGLNIQTKVWNVAVPCDFLYGTMTASPIVTFKSQNFTWGKFSWYLKFQRLSNKTNYTVDIVFESFDASGILAVWEILGKNLLYQSCIKPCYETIFSNGTQNGVWL